MSGGNQEVGRLGCADRVTDASHGAPAGLHPDGSVPTDAGRGEGGIADRLLAAVGGIEQFSRNWSWRSHSPVQRAESAIADARVLIGNGVDVLAGLGATAEQAEEWTAKSIRLWLAYQAAGSRTANPMITGPARFPVEKNRKAMESERRRGEEYYEFADHPGGWLARQRRRDEKAALSAEAATVEHRSIAFPGVRLVQNTTLNRIQLLFDGKPDPETISLLKEGAFRWSPREGAWQRQNTNNGVQAAYRVLRALGHGTSA